MEIIRTDDFREGAARLPKYAARLLREQEARFAKNWLDRRLHVKRLHDLGGAYSFRVTNRYRVLFFIRSNAAVFFAIGHRKEIYRRK